LLGTQRLSIYTDPENHNRSLLHTGFPICGYFLTPTNYTDKQTDDIMMSIADHTV